MIGRIAQKEFREILREGRFRVAALLTLALLVVAMVASRAYYLSVNEQHEQARQNERNVWVSQEAKNPHSAAHYGTYAFKPKYPLSLLDQGVDKYAGISIFLESHVRNEAQYMAAQDQTGLSRFGDLTPDFILLFIIPLLIILLAFNAFTREREQGTLSLLKSQGVPTAQLALGKWLGAYLPVLLITVLMFALAGILLATLSDFGRFEPSALLLLLMVYLVYYAVFTNLTLTVSALAKNSGVALVLMLAVWILSCLAMPKLASNLADGLYPYPTRQEFEAAIKEDKQVGLSGHDPWSEAAKKLEMETLAQYGVDSVQQLPFNFDGYLMQKGEEHEAEIYFKHYELLREQFNNQSRIYRRSALLSPFLPLRFLSMALANTDYESHWKFSDAAEKYRLQMMEALNMHFAENTKYGDWAYKADPALWQSVPEFSYTPPSTADILKQNNSNLLALLAWLVVSFLGLVVAVRRV